MTTTTHPAPDKQHEQEVLLDIRQIIEAEKARAAEIDAAPIAVSLDVDNPALKVNVPRPVKKAPAAKAKPKPEVEIDPSNVQVAADPKMAALLVGRLHTLRAEKRALESEEAAVKDILAALTGELEYFALAPGEKPVFSMPHEQTVRLNTATIKEQFPESEFPQLYTASTSRPLRLT